MHRNKVDDWLVMTLISFSLSFVWRIIGNDFSSVTLGEIGVRLLLAMLLSLMFVKILD